MNSTNELLIRIQPEENRIRLESAENGIVSYKEISQAVFYDCIKSSMRTDWVASGFLPQNCFHVGIGTDDSKSYCLWHPDLYADISYFGTQYPHFPLPRLVFGFAVSKEGKVFHCRLGVVKDERPTEDTPMFVYPFSNVGGFNLCTGNNPLPTYRHSHTLANLPRFLLSLPNNNDSFHRRNNRLGMDYRELLNHLQNKDPAYYYTDVLVPNQKTLRNFISGR